MDDQTFDALSARQWIETIEASPKSIRDSDIYPRLNAWMAQVSPRSVLEIGAGQGICSAKIDLTDRKYVGVDPSSFLIERANQLYSSENQKFILGNAYELPFADQSFDSVFSVAVWHLLSDLKASAAELNRVLKRGGAFHIITANPAGYSLWQNLYSEGKLDGVRFEGLIRNTDETLSKDILYFHPLTEILKSFEVIGLHLSATETFRKSENGSEDFLISIQGQRSE